MKKNTICTFFILLSLAIKTEAQTATILFNTDEDVTIEMYKPIDGAYNQWIPEKLNLKSGLTVNYTLKVDDFCFVQCKLPNNKRMDFLLLENDSLRLNYTNGTINIIASMGEVMDFYNGIWSPIYKDEIYKIFLEGNNAGKIDFAGIREGVRTLLSKDIEYLDRLKFENKINNKQAQILKDALYYSANGLVLFKYSQLIEFDENLTKEDVSAIKNEVYSIIESFPPFTEDIIKHRYSTIYLSQCIYFLYDRMDDSEKQTLSQKYDKSIFGNHINLFLTPEYMQSSLFGVNIFLQLKFNMIDSDIYAIVDFLKNKFPQSEYVSILISLLNDKNKNNQDVFFLDGKEVRSLSDLSQKEEIKGKYMYVDLWATWCGPCKYAFQYNDNLDSLLRGYKNLVKIYISIDDEKDEKTWFRQVKSINLRGYNFMASKNLYKEIREKIYNNGLFSIPRYLLINPDGHIVENDLSSPNLLDKLKLILDKHLKSD